MALEGYLTEISFRADDRVSDPTNLDNAACSSLLSGSSISIDVFRS